MDDLGRRLASERAMRIFLADDHALVRAGIRSLLEGQPGVEVVGEAGDGQTALQELVAARPDVALIDIAMPGLNGLELVARLRREIPATRLVILSMHGSPAHVAHALRAGVHGYLLKDAAVDELPVLLRAMSRGETYLSPAISRTVVEGFLDRATGQPADDGAGAGADKAAPLDVLTPRQREILQLVAEGRSTKEVARLLDLSIKTVESHRAQIMDRLDVHDLAGLVRYAVRTGLISP
jgi:DNA-binding NarL/FixJ family response regulator